MNADPEEGQPSTAPDTSAPETAEAEAAAADESVDADAVAEADAADAEVSEPEAEPEPAEAEAEADAEPEAELVEAEAAEPETAEAEPDDPEPPAPTPSAPLVAGRYRLVAEIGGGAMGVVWRARDEVLGRDVAVKELRPDHGMSGAQVRTSHQRARREGRIAARLQHPNAVVIYDVAEHEGRPYLIMEYVPSQSLGDILATGTVLTPAEVASIGAQLASALTAAHERGIVHRDIKPGNVLMTSDGTVKLTDFGISRATGDATVTATGEILGTPAYTAPEVAQGHPVAFPADVFSLGATLYAAVEGTPPFGEDVNAMALLLRVVRNEIRLPKRSGPLTDTIMRMLSPEPLDRPTMKEVWHGLDALSAKPSAALGLRATAPETKPFGAPSPTLVVSDASAAKGLTVAPESAPKPKPVTAAPPPAPALAPTPVATPNPTPTPTPTPPQSSIPTSAMDLVASTPTSEMASQASKIPATTRSAAASAATPPPPTSDQPVPAASAQPPAPRSRNRMPLAITVLVVGTAVLVVAIVFAMNSGKGTPNQPVAHGSTSSAPSSPAKPTSTGQSATTPSHTPSSSPSTSPSSTPSSTSSASTPSASATDTATQMTNFIKAYYALLPNNLTEAWPNMTAAYQTDVAKGFSGYQSFWGGISAVSVSDVVATLPSTVVASIHYTDKNGNTTVERTSFGLVKDGTSWKINTSHPIG